MGSKTPPEAASISNPGHTSQPEQSVSDLRRLLKQKDQEIRALRFELEKYKLALHQSQVEFHLSQQQHQTRRQDGPSSDDSSRVVQETQQQLSGMQYNTSQTFMGDIEAEVNELHEQRKQLAPTESEEASDTAFGDSSISKESSGQQSSRLLLTRQSITSAGSNTSSSKVIFNAGADDDNDNGDDMEDTGDKSSRRQSNLIPPDGDEDDEVQEVIQDLGEIDLDLELKQGEQKEFIDSSKSIPDKSVGKNKDEEVMDEDDDDIMSDNLLTSLTDAAISNLSQLAALQERCESRQRPVSNLDRTTTSTDHSSERTTTPCLGNVNRSSLPSTLDDSDPVFDVGSFSHPEALGLGRSTPTSGGATLITHHAAQQQNSSSSSISPTSTILQPDLSSSHSLASVVAAAAVAAAAANDQQHHQLHHRATHQQQQQQLHQSSPQSRLISSALQSSEYYHSLQQQHSHAQQASSLQQQTISPISSLHYSPSTSITPSPSSLMAQSRRSAASNTSSSLMSPIASPSYLRRQFMPDRIPILSPSPTTSLTTGSSSAASSSLAHLLQQHHHHHQTHQQRSASALAGTMASTSSTPLSGTGSSAVSPLLSSKNSSQARLNNMQIRHKFGYLGSGKAQFNSPHGFCLGLNQEIVVADTNNHRVCIFDKSGTYITQFGSPGKEEGQLWNPRKVAILHRPINGNSTTGVHPRQGQMISVAPHADSQSSGGHFGSEPLYVVCDRGAERSRMQLFTKDGAFIKKIGIHYIDIVAGLAITQNGLIIVVDSVSPTVYIINGETGSLNGWFDCSGHMKEPSDIAVKSDIPGNEYFICDFKGHCVVVFSEQGEYLRKIGHDGLTSYPNGIDISDDGDILVGDSHGNRFHVVVFDRNGNFVSQFECPHVKVSRCCGLKITREGYIVTLAKNNHHVLVLDTIHI